MPMPMIMGFAFGRIWADRRHVASADAKNRAGAVMAIGAQYGNPALGLVLANEAITSAAKVPDAAAGGTGGGGGGGGGAGAGGGGGGAGKGAAKAGPDTVATTVSFDQGLARTAREVANSVKSAAKAVETAAKAQTQTANQAMKQLGKGGKPPEKELK